MDYLKFLKLGIKKTGQVKIPVQSSLIVGGLDKFGSLNFAIPSIAASSLLFLDQQIKGDNYYSAVNNAEYIFPSIDENDFILSFVNDKYLIKPFDATNHHEPAKVSCYHYC